ncbi:MAG TPA: hypothetical protein VGO62_04015 [Myxococcota bacterium]|jgi:hypothetical protein
MNRISLFAVVCAVASAAAFVAVAHAPRVDHAHDPRFVTLGELAHELANDEQSYALVVDKLGGSVAPLGAVERALLMKLFRDRNYDALDAQPETELDTLRLGLDQLAKYRAAHPAQSAPPLPALVAEPLGLPSGKPGPRGEPFLDDVGHGFKHGDRIDADKAKRGADSDRFAMILESLALHGGSVRYNDSSYDDVTALVTALAHSGHTVTVLDQRLAANFGDLEHNGKFVATPLWVRTGRIVNGSDLALPVPHAQLLLMVRGPQVNADVTLYPSLDLGGDGSGGTHFRSDVTGDQPWCGGIEAHRYVGDDALTAVRLMVALTRTVDARVRDRALPLDGYFALGVCTLAPAVIEQAILHRSTVWPLTHDPALFDGDSEIDKLVRALPHDGRGAPPPDDARLFGAVPWPTLDAVPFQQTRAQLRTLHFSGATGS